MLVGRGFQTLYPLFVHGREHDRAFSQVVLSPLFRRWRGHGRAFRQDKRRFQVSSLLPATIGNGFQKRAARSANPHRIIVLARAFWAFANVIAFYNQERARFFQSGADDPGYGFIRNPPGSDSGNFIASHSWRVDAPKFCVDFLVLTLF